MTGQVTVTGNGRVRLEGVDGRARESARARTGVGGSASAPPGGSVSRVLLQNPVMVTVGGVVVDVQARVASRGPGSKHDAEIGMRLGGAPVNAGAFGPANGFPTAVVAAQPKELWAGVCRVLAAESGLQLSLQEREEPPTVSLITPNHVPGRSDIYCQRIRPPTVSELTPEIRAVFAKARAVLAGPMRWSAEVGELLQYIPVLAPEAFLALLPHPEMIRDPAFPMIASRYRYVQMNEAESRLLEGGTDDLVVNARRLSHLLGEATEVAITGGSARGYLWTRERWLTIDPPRVRLVQDCGCGDAFGGAYLVGRALLGLSAESARDYAVTAATAVATQVRPGRPLAYRETLAE